MIAVPRSRPDSKRVKSSESCTNYLKDGKGTPAEAYVRKQAPIGINH